MHMYIVLKATSVSPSQQPADLPLPTGMGDGRSEKQRGLLPIAPVLKWGQRPVAVAQLIGKAASAGWNEGGTGVCRVPSLHPQRLASAWLCHWPQPLPIARKNVVAGLQCLRSTSILCKSRPTNVDSLGIYSSKAAGAGFYSREKRFSQGWVLEFGHLSSGVAALQAAVPCLDLALSTIEG